jgi:hypothetical protein
MPMTAAVAPRFAARYPEAAIVFDNLHSMHDVISDILANPAVPRGRKRAEILLAARRYRDDTTSVVSEPEWRRMAAMMGIENQGGPAVGFLPALPTPTVARGAVMRHDAHGGDAREGGHGGGHEGAHGAGAPARPAPARSRERAPAPAVPAPAVPAVPAGGHGSHHPHEHGGDPAGSR